MEMDLFYLSSVLHLAYMNTHEIFASPINVLNITKVILSVKRIFSKRELNMCEYHFLICNIYVIIENLQMGHSEGDLSVQPVSRISAK